MITMCSIIHYVLAHLDYCNVALADLLASTLQLDHSSHLGGSASTWPCDTSLQMLHWLPVTQRIQY